MKFNKWTVGLAAVGLVSLTSAARADEKPSAVQTALSNTTISGDVSASANVGLTQNYANSPAAGIDFQKGKLNGFNLDVVKLSIAKPEDESPWASGYQVDLLFGPDAVGYNNVVGGGTGLGTAGNTAGGDFAIKQAYVSLRTPVGNGLDWKIGVFDSPLGYESFDGNPNYTRSYGYAIEPTELTGVEASYKFSDAISATGGVADTSSAGINNRNYDAGLVKSQWHEAYFGDVTLTAPSSWGWLSGSALTAGMLYGGVDTLGGGFTPAPHTYTYMGGNQVNYYAGLTLNTPWKQFTTGVAFDYVRNFGGGYQAVGGGTAQDIDEQAYGLYATYKATDKLSFNARGEYVEGDAYNNETYQGSVNLVELTGTVEYDLWANVVSRLEIRWDQNMSGKKSVDLTESGLSSPAIERESVGLYANVVYKF